MPCVTPDEREERDQAPLPPQRYVKGEEGEVLVSLLEAASLLLQMDTALATGAEDALSPRRRDVEEAVSIILGARDLAAPQEV